MASAAAAAMNQAILAEPPRPQQPERRADPDREQDRRRRPGQRPQIRCSWLKSAPMGPDHSRPRPCHAKTQAAQTPRRERDGEMLLLNGRLRRRPNIPRAPAPACPRTRTWRCRGWREALRQVAADDQAQSEAERHEDAKRRARCVGNVGIDCLCHLPRADCIGAEKGRRAKPRAADYARLSRAGASLINAPDSRRANPGASETTTLAGSDKGFQPGRY